MILGPEPVPRADSDPPYGRRPPHDLTGRMGGTTVLNWLRPAPTLQHLKLILGDLIKKPIFTFFC